MLRQWKLYKPRLGEDIPPPFPAMLRVWDGPELARGEEATAVDLDAVRAICDHLEAEAEQRHLGGWDAGMRDAASIVRNSFGLEAE